MRTKTLLFMLVIMAIALCALTVTALAANETSMSTTVTFTKEAPPPSEPSLPSSTYEVNIPASVTISNPYAFTEFNITASNVSLSDGQSVVVYIDNASFGDGEYLHIKNSDNDVIRVHMRLRYNENITALKPDDVVAKFNHDDTPATENRTVLIVPFQDEVEAAPSGTYTGTMHFKIALVDN